MNQYASIYVREAGVPGVRWAAGPMPLEAAHVYIAGCAKWSLGPGIGEILYYELRGLDGCAVRYRLWLERPAPYVRQEVLFGRPPGGRTNRSREEV